ncbi:MAG: 2-amino-4-hydroxy-6-hydroxymethyldihydropteridine diphosphokinase [Bacteroidales bacterium]|nr:2-amino-4-hydroxy-6-hydroxymethyldihydropteridine diphosphokinase [Bacteroidales bacterium]
MKPEAEDIVLLLGGNVGDTHVLLAEARIMLSRRVGEELCCSGLYETEPWGMVAQQMFINQAVLLRTELAPLQCLNELQAIEIALGRQPHAVAYNADGSRRYASRPIDIDIIFYGSQVLNTPRLTVPHPRMHLRRFVLEPLVEVVPNYIHPLLKRSVVELLADCHDDGCVTRIG